MPIFPRTLNPLTTGVSAFLFGPRMTGKTTLLRGIPADAWFDLLDPALELQYRANPGLFWEQLSAIREEAVIVVDEVQRAPELLNVVQMGIDRRRQVFLLSGSSARKLRRGGANLLGGRALDLRLHPLCADELGKDFRMDRALSFGTLPQIATLVTEKREDVARQLLASYVTTYLREEIQAEALTRNVGAFARFLQIAAQHHGQVIEFASISRDCAVPASTVKEYFQILEDTLIGFLLWPFDRSERKKSRPRFYLFDCGVIRALQQRLEDPPTPAETGFLFENWVVNELRRIRDYERKPHEFAFWRERDRVVDLLVTKGNRVIHAFKCKSGRTDLRPGVAGRFREIFPGVPLAVISMSDARPRMADGVEILPVKEALQRYRAL